MNDRLDKFLLSEQLSPAKFADIIGVQRSSISHIVSGRNKPSFDFIAKVLLKFPRLNPEWLILGKGDMYKRMVQTSLFDSPPAEAVPESLADVNPEPYKVAAPAVDASSASLGSSASPDLLVDSSSVGTSGGVAPFSGVFDKEVERIIVFYKDRTFKSYTASED